jgi:hypothetical protein
MTDKRKKAQLKHTPHVYSPEAIQRAYERGELAEQLASSPSVNRLRDSIKAHRIIDKLDRHIMSDRDLMSPSQVQAAKILLNKRIPDLKAMELTGADGSALPQAISINITQPIVQAISINITQPIVQAAIDDADADADEDDEDDDIIEAEFKTLEIDIGNDDNGNADD